MTLRFHPEDATLVSYAAGALPQSIALLVGSHIEMCPACGAEMRLVAALSGAALACAPVEAVEAGAFLRLAARLDEAVPSSAALAGPGTEASGLPGPLARFVGGGIEAIPWREALPGIEHCRYVLSSARGESFLRLLRAAPGREIPDHAHSGQEATLVLRGALSDGDRVYLPGEFCDLDDATVHAPKVHGDAACICAIAEEGPPKFVSAELAAYLRQAGI